MDQGRLSPALAPAQTGAFIFGAASIQAGGSADAGWRITLAITREPVKQDAPRASGVLDATRER